MRKIKIIDKKTGNVIANNYIIDGKEASCEKRLESPLISLDRKFFFSENNLNIIIQDDNTNDIVVFNEEYLKENFKYEYWRNYSDNPNADFYRDFTINEIDEEVVPLVKALNLVDGIKTLGSCCGHGEGILWVSMEFESLECLTILLHIIDKNFRDVFKLTTSINLCQDSCCPRFELQTQGIIGQEAYKQANLLAKQVKEIY